MNTNQLPTMTSVEQDGRAFWEIEVPGADLSANLANVTLTSNGLYIELANGRWDMIPFAELADLVDTADARAHIKPGRNGSHAVQTILGIPILGTVVADPVLGTRIVPANSTP